MACRERLQRQGEEETLLLSKIDKVTGDVENESREHSNIESKVVSLDILLKVAKMSQIFILVLNKNYAAMFFDDEVWQDILVKHHILTIGLL